MKFLSREEFLKDLDDKKKEAEESASNSSNRDKVFTENGLLDFREVVIEGVDLSGLDLSGIDFSWATFVDVVFAGSRFVGSCLEHVKCTNVDFASSDMTRSSLVGGDFRGCNLSRTNCDGTNFTASQLEGANLEGLIDTDSTIHFRNHCPQDCYIFGYKKCFNNRMVKLLIPKNAKRCSSTTNACRCERARVVAITDMDGNGSYKEAVSFVDENFIYRLGEMAVADSYHEDRWLDSSHGIHFWMTFEEALGYM